MAVITACGGSGSHTAAVARSRALGKEASGRSVQEADRWTCGIGVAHGQWGGAARAERSFAGARKKEGGRKNAPTSGVSALVKEGGGTATRGRNAGADRWGELGRRRELGGAMRHWRGRVREWAVHAPLGLGGLLG